MRYSRSSVSLRTFGLAFAVALSPAFFQTAYTCERGDTYLLTLNFGAPEGSSIPFNPNLRDYSVSTSADTVFMRVKTRDAGSTASYIWRVGGTTIDSGCIGVCGEPGGGDVTLTIPDEQSTLSVAVRAPGNTSVGYYTIEVDHLSPFECTEAGIRAAIAMGTGPHTFACAGPTTVMTDAEIVIDNSVWLDGEGKLTVDGRNTHRVFSIGQGVTAWLTGITVTGGDSADCGGGIFSEGALTLTDSVVTGNSAYAGGGVCSVGDVILNDTTVSGNTAVSHGGGVLCGSGMLLLNRSALTGNSAEFGGGASIFPTSACALTLINSTVSGNSASLVGGGLFAGGGTVIAYYSTIAANNAHPEAPSGAICVSGGQVSLTKTLIQGDCGCPELPVSNGYNIGSRGDGCGLTQPTDQPGVPGGLALGPLQDNGGATPSHLPAAGSVAIDAIPPEECFPGVTDQRDVPRPQGSGCDVGAVEFGPADSGSPLVFSEVGWEITGNGEEPISGFIDINSPGSTASVEVFGLPPGSDYSIEMFATSEEGWAVSCVGSVGIDVVAGYTNEVDVMLNCDFGKPPLSGLVRVGGSYPSCSPLTQAVVSPLQTSIGDDIDVFASAVDDGVGDPIEYLWTGSGGSSFADPTAQLTTYTCIEAGNHAITITVSDGIGSCAWTVIVTCVDPRPESQSGRPAPGSL